MRPTTNRPRKRCCLNEELRYRHDVQRSSFQKLEGRAAIVLSAATAAVLFVAKEDVSSGWLPPALLTFAGSIVFALIAVVPSQFDELAAREVVTGLWLRSRGNAAAELTNNRLLRLEANMPRQAKMTRRVRIAVALVLVGAILSTIHLTTGDRPDVIGQEGSPACDPRATSPNGCDP